MNKYNLSIVFQISLGLLLSTALWSQCPKVTSFDVDQQDLGNGNCRYSFDITYSTEEASSMKITVGSGFTKFVDNQCTGAISGSNTITYGPFQTICQSNEFYLTYHPYENTFCGGIDCGCVTMNPSILPIELSDLKIERDHNFIFISWKTQQEVDNQYFSLEHSENGHSYIEIYRVDSKGNSDQPQFYEKSIPIDKLIGPHHYFRLRFVDIDGKYQISKSVYTFTPITNNFIGYPNPIIDKYQLQKAFTGTIVILNDQNEVIEKVNCVDRIYFNLSHLSSGNYQLQFLNEEKLVGTSRITKF